ncbi:AMP-binding protein [Roseibacillus persicicus]|uniref:AMP-binding protein n=1 Tax=Roseibacillus persicicus TaxID=454148 RepID=UPI00280CBDB5|nr:AMP-binding protein [Roseibacillus persicicus]MDQ8191424.1 AMP-binding protein [Roseibacillus persicicus]
MLSVYSPPHLREDGERLAAKHPELSGYLFATSGTTGSPKWILHRREGLDICAETVNTHFHCTASDTWGLALPEFHVGGFCLTHRARQAGGQLARFEQKWDATSFSLWAQENKVTITSLVPTQVFDLVKEKQTAPPKLRLALIGGEHLNNTLHAKAIALGWPLVTSYGMTETAGLIAAGKVGETHLRPLPGWVLAKGQEGQLTIAGPGLFAGYLAESGLTETEIPFSTKDLVDFKDGLLEVRGRCDDQIKIRGELVDLHNLRAGLAELIPSRRTTVIALPEERCGYQLFPVIEGPQAFDQEISQWNNQLPAFSRCQPAVFLTDWPKTPLGKIDFRALTEQISRQQDYLLRKATSRD